MSKNEKNNLLVVCIFVVKATYKPAIKMARKVVAKMTVKTIPTPMPTKVIEAKQEVTPTIMVTPTPAKKSIQQIKKFADTGAITVTAQEGDSFWKIADRVCGTGVLSESIQEQNKYTNQSLQMGDVLMVNCN